MSLAVSDLRLKEFYDPPVAFDLAAFRKALRGVREQTIGRNELADQIGLSASTIQSAETGNKVPRIDTVAKIIEGSGTTLAAFFSALDNHRAEDVAQSLPLYQKPTQDSPTPSTEADHVVVVPPAAVVAFTPEQFAQLLQVVRVSLGEKAFEARARQAAKTRARKPVRGAHRVKGA